MRQGDRQESLNTGKPLLIADLKIFRVLTLSSVAAGRYTMDSDNILSFDKKWPMETSGAASGQLQLFVSSLTGASCKIKRQPTNKKTVMSNLIHAHLSNFDEVL